MSKHVCTDTFHSRTTLAHCNNHPKWSVARSVYGGMWFACEPYAIDVTATFLTWAQAFAYADRRARLAAREATR